MKHILLADDHAIVRTGLRLLIESIAPGSIIEEAAQESEAREKIKLHDYDLAVIDVNMPNTDAFRLVTDFLSYRPGLKILMFSMNAEEIYAKKFLALGVMGYVRKDSADDEIQTAITTVLANRRYTSDAFQSQIVNELSAGKSVSNPFALLTGREFEIVRLLLSGDSGGAIGDKLSLHTSTVGTHKARILKKLDCTTILDLQRLAQAYDLIIK